MAKWALLGLLILGGRFAFAGGNYAGTQLAELLPVGVGKAFSVHVSTEPLKLHPSVADALTRKLDWGAAPVVVSPQIVGPVAPDAQVRVKVGDSPFLVTRRVGKGRVAAVLASVEGTGRPGAPLFCEWRDWPEFLSRVMIWLRGGRS